MKKIKNEKKPFFSKFLESQAIEDTKNLKGGGSRPRQTNKHPSDTDEGGIEF